MLPGMNPKQMAGMMKQMGIDVKEVDASKVVIEKKDGSVIVIENPSVQQISMKGEKSFQVAGEVIEEATGGTPKEKEDSDVEIIMRECGVSAEDAEQALQDANGDLAEAILKLSGE